METVNELIYTPKGERDYGTLACWGTNSIGKQMEPCLFQVVPAGMYSELYIFNSTIIGGEVCVGCGVFRVGRDHCDGTLRFSVN